MEYVTVTQIAEKRGLFTCRVCVLFADGDLEGVGRKGKKHLILATTNVRWIIRNFLKNKDSAFTLLFRSID